MRDRPHNVLDVESEVWVADSKNRVVAIFLLPVWLLALSGRSFLPYFGPCCCRIAYLGHGMLPIRKLGATYINLWTGSKIQKPEVLSKMPEIIRNVVKFTVIRKMRDKKVAD